MRVEQRLLRASPKLRQMVIECERMARDVKIHLVYVEMLARGDGYNSAVRNLCKRFGLSKSTVKRSLRRMWRSEEEEGELH